MSTKPRTPPKTTRPRLPNAANAENTVKRYEDLHGRTGKKKLDALSLLSSFSSFLGRAALRDAEMLDLLTDKDFVGAAKTHADHLAASLALLEGCSQPEKTLAALRKHKYREFARIVLRDITGRAPFTEVMRELSDLASSVVEAVYRLYCTELGLDAGTGFVVMGMGKLGGRDLNLSSDIDIVYYYDDGPDPEAIFKLAEMMTKGMSAVTEEGFLYRVDIALRPGGGKSPIAVSKEGALEHYFYWGDTWERAALIKARPVAGDLELGEGFCAEIESFVYRKDLDYASIEDLKHMKVKLNKLQKPGDVKLGRGGIREIEFFVQALQLVNAGAIPELRSRYTLEALGKLGELGIVSPEVRAELEESYIFLRRVEHNIQLVDERQTHLLPRDACALEVLARMVGFEGAREFTEEYERCTSGVSRIYGELFYEPSGEVERVGEEFWELADFLTVGNVTEAEALGSLSALGFQHPERALELFGALLDPRRGGLTQKGRSLTKRVIPALLHKAISSPAPDAVLMNLERFISSVGLRTNIFAMLAENPDIIELLAKLFSTSGFLSNFLVRHPEYLDVITLSSARREFGTKAEMVEALGEMLSETDDYEEKLDIMRRFKHVETLKLCLRDLNGEIEAGYTGEYISMIADALLETGLSVAAGELGMKRGMLSKILVLGLGKLGGGEMSYNSDLDLVFIYEGGQHEKYSKLCQRLISVLSIPTGEGFAFKIDTRLRPSGRSGALVTSFESFKDYQEHSAQLWERQALIRTRAVAGSAALGKKVMETIRHEVYDKPLPVDFHAEIDRVRGRMERELARESPKKLNLKTGRGGLVDIEFIVQMLQLRHGGEHPALRTPNTLEALDVMRAEGLMEGSTYTDLRRGLLFLRKVENKLRLHHDRSTNELRHKDFENLAGEMGLDVGDEGLLAIYKRTTERIREIYEGFFQTYS